MSALRSIFFERFAGQRRLIIGPAGFVASPSGEGHCGGRSGHLLNQISRDRKASVEWHYPVATVAGRCINNGKKLVLLRKFQRPQFQRQMGQRVKAVRAVARDRLAALSPCVLGLLALWRRQLPVSRFLPFA